MYYSSPPTECVPIHSIEESLGDRLKQVFWFLCMFVHVYVIHHVLKHYWLVAHTKPQFQAFFSGADFVTFSRVQRIIWEFVGN